MAFILNFVFRVSVETECIFLCCCFFFFLKSEERNSPSPQYKNERRERERSCAVGLALLVSSGCVTGLALLVSSGCASGLVLLVSCSCVMGLVCLVAGGKRAAVLWDLSYQCAATDGLYLETGVADAQ